MLPSLGGASPILIAPPKDEQVYERLRRAIVEGRVMPGQELAVANLAVELGVSRIPVMRACQRLIGEGFLETNARRSVVVAPLTDARVVEEFTLLDALECMAVRVAAEAGSRGHIVARWQRINATMARHMDDDTPDACAAGNLEFHAAVWDSLSSPYVRNLVALIWDHLEPARQLATVNTPWERSGSVAEHQAICDAVLRGDPAAAEAAVRAHRQNHVTRVRATLRQRDQSDQRHAGSSKSL